MELADMTELLPSMIIRVHDSGSCTSADKSTESRQSARENAHFGGAADISQKTKDAVLGVMDT